MDAPKQSRNIRKNRILHPCPQCGKTFTKRSNMLIHARLHTGETPYVCKYAGCGRSYKWLSSINFHEGRCERKHMGLAVPPPRPPPPPAAAEAARQAAAAAAITQQQQQQQQPTQPQLHHLPPPLPSYHSLQMHTQGRTPSPPPPPPPPPLRPPPQFEPPHIPQLVYPPPPHAQLPTQATSAPVLHPQGYLPPSIAPRGSVETKEGFRTPKKGKRFRGEMIPMSPVTPGGMVVGPKKTRKVEPGSPESVGSKEVKELLGHYVPGLMLGGEMEIGESFGLGEELFMPVGSVFDEIAVGEVGGVLGQGGQEGIALFQ